MVKTCRVCSWNIHDSDKITIMHCLHKNGGAQCCIGKGYPLGDQCFVFSTWTFPAVMFGNVEKDGTAFE